MVQESEIHSASQSGSPIKILSNNIYTEDLAQTRASPGLDASISMSTYVPCLIVTENLVSRCPPGPLTLTVFLYSLSQATLSCEGRNLVEISFRLSVYNVWLWVSVSVPERFLGYIVSGSWLPKQC